MNVPGGGVWSSKHTEIIRESAEGLSVATVIIQRQQTDLIRTGWSSRGGDAHTHTHKKTNEKKKPLIKSLRRVSVQKVNYYIMFPLLELQLCSWHLLMSTRVCVCDHHRKCVWCKLEICNFTQWCLFSPSCL